MNKIGGIVLAAGKGKRMNSKDINKVVLPLADKPMILHAVSMLEKLHAHPIVIVVGFAKQSVMDVLGEKVYFAEQTKRLGTAHALLCGLRQLPEPVENILVTYGDDFAYPEKVVEKLIKKHIVSDAALTFLTIDVVNPFGFGRIVRDKDQNVTKIVEEKDATTQERKITEINPGCYVFKTSFLHKYLKRVPKSPISNEYYLTSLIDLAITGNEIVETVRGGRIPWRGVNTPEELKEAEKIYLQRQISE